MWNKLDTEYQEEVYIEADEALAEFERCRRSPGQSMRDYLLSLRLARVRVERQDPGSEISDLSYARRMLRKSGLTKLEQRQVLGTAGAAWDANTIETALIMMYGDAHQDNKGRARQLDGGGRDSRPRPSHSMSSASTRSGGSSSYRGRGSSRGSNSTRGKGSSRRSGTFAAGIAE